MVAAHAPWGYTPYGEPLVPLGPPLAPWGYTGEWEDPSGLVYLRARWYSALLGRFTQRDPEPGMAMWSASQYAYAYAGANPVSFADPTGRLPPQPPPLRNRNYSESEMREVAEEMAEMVCAEGSNMFRYMSTLDKTCVMWLFVNKVKDYPDKTWRQHRNAFAMDKKFVPRDHARDVALAESILRGEIRDPTCGAYFMLDDTQFRECYGKGHQAELTAQFLIDSLKLRGGFTMWVEFDRTAHGLKPLDYRNEKRNLEVTRGRIGHYFYKWYDWSQAMFPEWARGWRAPCPPRQE